MQRLNDEVFHKELITRFERSVHCLQCQHCFHRLPSAVGAMFLGASGVDGIHPCVRTESFPLETAQTSDTRHRAIHGSRFT